MRCMVLHYLAGARGSPAGSQLSQRGHLLNSKLYSYCQQQWQGFAGLAICLLSKACLSSTMRVQRVQAEIRITRRVTIGGTVSNVRDKAAAIRMILCCGIFQGLIITASFEVTNDWVWREAKGAEGSAHHQRSRRPGAR